MEALTQKLQKKSAENPQSVSLRTTLAHLSDLPSEKITWDVLKADFDLLEAEGLWEKLPENEALLTGLHAAVAAPRDGASKINGQEGSARPGDKASMAAEMSKNVSGGQRVSMVPPPIPLSAPLFPLSSLDTTVLPLELIDVLNHTYFLHLLATDTEKVLPPGKSLLSVMSRPSARHRADGDSLTLEDRIEDLAYQAFWDEVLLTLSDPLPSVQLPRLRRLYEDLHVALVPLLPPQHPILVTLSSPLSPTSSPLSSAIVHLRELVSALRERCAPVRDADVDSLIHELDFDAPPSPLQSAKLVRETIRGVLRIAEAMKEDMSQFVLGTMGEAQLRAMVANEAIERERELVLQLWGRETVENAWRQWSNHPRSLTGRDLVGRTWVSRLVEVLGSNVPVSCSLPTKTVEVSPSSEGEQQPSALDNTSHTARNELPPPLFFVTPTLLYVQNYLQALVIAASLRSLIHIPVQPSTHANASAYNATTTPSFVDRIWTLLKAEIDGEPGAGDTKLVNLADEVIRTRRLINGITSDGSEEQESRLRAAVDRTLQLHDPVFVLLQKRLLRAVSDRLGSSNSSAGSREFGVPKQMQTGRSTPGARQTVHLKMEIPEAIQDRVRSIQHKEERPMVVKGFEDPVLVGAVTEALGRLRGCVEWTEEVWQFLFEIE